MQWRQLDNMQAICILVQTDNHTTTSSLSFYRLVALPVPGTKLTVSNTEGIEKGILLEKNNFCNLQIFCSTFTVPVVNLDKSSRLPAQLLHTSLVTLAQWPRASSSSVIYVFCQMF